MWAFGPRLDMTGRQCVHVRTCKTLVLKCKVTPQHYKSTQDAFLNNFHFLHYTQILQCLTDQWWAFGPQLLASSRFLNAYIGSDDLWEHSEFCFYFMTFMPKFIGWQPGVKKLNFEKKFDTFGPFGWISWLKWKKIIKQKSSVLSIPMCVVCFFYFLYGKA